MNHDEAIRGAPLAIRAQTRRAELRRALTALAPDRQRDRTDLDLAIAEVGELLAGDLFHLSSATSAGLERWLVHVERLGGTPRGAKAGRA